MERPGTTAQSSSLDLDPTGPGSLSFGKEKPQDPVLQVGSDSVAIDLVTQDERSLVIAKAMFLVHQPRFSGAGASIRA